jgi:hypothetical protein
MERMACGVCTYTVPPTPYTGPAAMQDGMCSCSARNLVLLAGAFPGAAEG